MLTSAIKNEDIFEKAIKSDEFTHKYHRPVGIICAGQFGPLPHMKVNYIID